MADKLLVICQPAFVSIHEDEIKEALPTANLDGPFHMASIAAFREGSIQDSISIDWRRALEQQERQFSEHLAPHLRTHNRMAFFGIAPIPLAVHLGSKLGTLHRIQEFQRCQFDALGESYHWRWSTTEVDSLSIATNGPQPTRRKGPLIFRVATRCPISVELTHAMVPNAVAEVDVSVSPTGIDVLRSAVHLDQLGNEVRAAIDRIRTEVPNCTEIHLFAAVPMAAAFRIGRLLAPTTAPCEVVTYQHFAGRYIPAIRIGETSTAVLRTPPYRPRDGSAGRRLTVTLLHAIHEATLRLGFDRKVLLGHAGGSFVAGLPERSTPEQQMLSDLQHLNGLSLSDQSVPLVDWLLTARHLARVHLDREIFEEALSALGVPTQGDQAENKP